MRCVAGEANVLYIYYIMIYLSAHRQEHVQNDLIETVVGSPNHSIGVDIRSGTGQWMER